MSPLFGSDLGTTGLIDTPTARMRPDGEFGAKISKQSLVDIYSLNYQATPWLETTFRYSAFTDVGFYDRSYEVKLRLLQEGRILPEVAIGVRDLLGTGVFSSEYLVGSKAFGAFDVSLGIGWGRFANRVTFTNPLTQLSDSFAERNIDIGEGGTVQFDSFFAGPEVGVFGGLSYDLKEYNLRLMAEYNSDLYLSEQYRGYSIDPSPISYGIEWEPIKSTTLGVSRQFGEQWAFNIATTLDSKKLPERYPSKLFVSSLDLSQIEELSERHNLGTWYERLRYDMARSGLVLRAASRNTNDTEVSLIVGNTSYSMGADAIGMALTLAELHLPSSFRALNLIIEEGGIQPVTINYLRLSGSSIWVAPGTSSINILPGRELENPTEVSSVKLRAVSLSAELDTRFQIFDPENPLRYQLLARISATSNPGWGWRLRGSYALDIDNNFNEITRPSDSVLPHVRSDTGLYLREGASGLESLYIERKDNLKSDVFYRLYAGVLEDMYSGIGGELLYQPFRSRLAYGFSANWVKQRDYDRSFSHLDYDTVTAFASVYWATPWYNYDVAIHAGQYLAKDLGATFEVRRTFDNGWMVGAWATLTDVPFDDFGEGSFDKGMFFRIPLQNLFGINTRAASATAIRSIQRDGGQRLESFSGRLWYDLRSTRYDALDNNRVRMAP